MLAAVKGSTGDCRDVWWRSTGSIPIFAENLLPRLRHNIDATKVVAFLQKAANVGSANLWKASPSDSRDRMLEDCRHEDKEPQAIPAASNALQDIVTEIIRHSGVRSDKQPIVTYMSIAAPPSYDDRRKPEDSTADSFFAFRSRAPRRHDDARVFWRDLCCPGVFAAKAKDSDAREPEVSNRMAKPLLFSHARQHYDQNLLEHVPSYAARPSASACPRIHYRY